MQSCKTLAQFHSCHSTSLLQLAQKRCCPSDLIIHFQNTVWNQILILILVNIWQQEIEQVCAVIGTPWGMLLQTIRFLVEEIWTVLCQRGHILWGGQRYRESDVQTTGIPALTARDVTWRGVRRETVVRQCHWLNPVPGRWDQYDLLFHPQPRPCCIPQAHQDLIKTQHLSKSLHMQTN